MNGRGGEARTPNTRFWRPVLYQLNYAPIGINKLAEWTGLEPATPCVTGRYSNQLNYHSEIGISSDLLSHGDTPHYHWRNSISLLSSVWIQVALLHYDC